MGSTYLPTGLPLPYPMPDDEQWWKACQEERLTVQRCTECGTLRHPPMPICAACRSWSFDWMPVSGRGKIFSFTVAYRASHPAVVDSLPYNIVVVELDDAPGIRFVSNVVNCEPEKIAIGMPVEVVWEKASDEITLPRFRAVREE